MKTKLYTTLSLGNKPAMLFLAVFLFFISVINAQTFNMYDPEIYEPPGGAFGASANVFDPGAPVELGIKFRVTQSGTLDSIRFFKGNTNTGTHVGSVWDNNGNLLATVTFTGETATGWQQMKFPTPVVLVPGITYTASYWGSGLAYTAESGLLDNNDNVRGPFILIAGSTASTSVADPGNEGNGVYKYSPDPATTPAGAANNFPDQTTGDATHYWVDVAFTTFFPLPVSLVDFRAATQSSNVSLTWKTESEQNNKGFQIERSNDGATWYNVSFVNGAGESSTSKSYSYLDKTLAPGNYYYRLKQVDYDGHSKTSSIVPVTIGGKGTVSLLPGYPNPMHGGGQIRFDLPSAQTVRLSIYDISGREVKVLLTGKQATGSHVATIDGLDAQTYFVRLQTESGILTQKIVVQ